MPLLTVNSKGDVCENSLCVGIPEVLKTPGEVSSTGSSHSQFYPTGCFVIRGRGICI